MSAPAELASETSRSSSGTAIVVVLLVAGLVTGFVVGYYTSSRNDGISPPATNTIAIPGSTAHLSVLAGQMSAMNGYYIGGLMSPTVVVKTGAIVTIYFSNIDAASNRSLVISSSGPPYGVDFRPVPAFPGAETPNPYTGVPPGESATFTFTASTAGTYWYVCGIPGHAAMGMYGKFVVQA